MSKHQRQHRIERLLAAHAVNSQENLVALLADEDSIREVIAFPKTNKAMGLLENSPSAVEAAQLRELSLQIRP